MVSKYAPLSNPPVPFEKHYEIYKEVEEKIMVKLGELEHEVFLIGLRVAYDVTDSSNPLDLLPFKIESGYLEPVDSVLECSQIDEESGDKIWQETTRSNVSAHPLPREFLDELYDATKGALQALAGQTPLRTGVFVVLNGSNTMAYGISCSCPGPRLKYITYDRTGKVNHSYCTSRGC